MRPHERIHTSATTRARPHERDHTSESIALKSQPLYRATTYTAGTIVAANSGKNFYNRRGPLLDADRKEILKTKKLGKNNSARFFSFI